MTTSDVAFQAPIEAPLRVEPDLDFIAALSRRAGRSLKKCMQCGTCSATCELSPENTPFPRQQMAWAAWGLREPLLRDPAVWLCHQCEDCSARCPRGARPGDVLAAVRDECVARHAAPRFLARWAGQPRFVPLLLAIPAVLLTLTLLVGQWLGLAPITTAATGDRIVFSFSSRLPHVVLNGFFGLVVGLVVFSAGVSVARYWRAMCAHDAGRVAPSCGLLRSVARALCRAGAHENFARCAAPRQRLLAHLLVVSGFVGLTLVTLWVITLGVNPLAGDGLVYPFGFFNPWKLLANAGGAAIVLGCALMMADRLMKREGPSRGGYADWALLTLVLLATLSGFASEALHYLRIEPHRFAAYFVHLMFVFALLAYLPFSKLAHVVYRTTAMVYAERTGRTVGDGPAGGAEGQDGNP